MSSGKWRLFSPGRDELIITQARGAIWNTLSVVYTTQHLYTAINHSYTCASVSTHLQYISINMYTVFALLCFVVVIHWLIFPYPSGLLHWHCGNLTIAPVPAKQPWWIWINTSCEFIMNDCITTTKQSTTKPCAYFLGYTVRDDTVPLFARTTVAMPATARMQKMQAQWDPFMIFNFLQHTCNSSSRARHGGRAAQCLSWVFGVYSVSVFCKAKRHCRYDNDKWYHIWGKN